MSDEEKEFEDTTLMNLKLEAIMELSATPTNWNYVYNRLAKAEKIQDDKREVFDE